MRVFIVLLFAVAALLASAGAAHAEFATKGVSYQPAGTVGASVPVIFSGSVKSTGYALAPSSAKLYVDGVSLPRASFTAALSGTSAYFSYTPSPKFTDGAHTFKVEVADTAGTVSTYQWGATVAQAPLASWTSPLQGATIHDGQPEIGLSVSDNTPGTAISVSGQVHSGTAAGPVVATFGSTGLSAGGLAFSTASELAPGVYYLTAVVKDAAGNATTLQTLAARGFASVAIPAMTELTECEGCHPTLRANHPTPIGVDCTLCHLPAETTHSEGHDCLGCHGDGYHINGARTAVTITGSCVTCHTADRPRVPRHTADSVASSHAGSCGGCHKTSLTAKHSATPAGSAYPPQCDLCHANKSTSVTAAIASGSAACSGCHDGNHQSADAAHTFTGMSSSCQAEGCHSNKLPDTHAPFVGEGKRYPEYDTSCELCHANSDPNRIPANPTADCTSCHNGYSGGDSGHAAVHEATLGSLSSVDSHNGVVSITPIDCVTCHGSSNLITLHGNDCSVCHAAGGPRSSFVQWDKGCQQGDCHPSIHAEAGSGHAESSYCEDCHNDSDWSVPCLDCHLHEPDTVAPQTYSSVQTTYTHPATAPAVIHFSTSDNAGPIVYRTYYRLDGGATSTVVNGQVSVPAPSSGSQGHDLQYWSEDWSHNVEQPHSAHFTITVDTTPPHTTSNAKSLYTGTASIKLTATDDSPDFGVRATYYRLDRGAITTGTAITIPAPSSLTTHTLEFWSVDGAGNVEPRNSVDLTQAVDSYPPVATLYLSRYQQGTSPRATMKATDVGDSGVAAMWATIDQTGTVLQTLGGTSTGALTTLYGTTLPEGWYNMKYWAVDAVGNSSSRETTTFCLDAHGPTVTCPYAWNAYVSGSTTLTMSITDAVSGVDPSRISYSISYYDSTSRTNVYLKGTSGSVLLTAPPTGSRFYSGSYTVYDRAGNYGYSAVGVNVSAAPYTLTYLAGSGGTILGTTPQTVAPGASGSAVTAVPNTGYRFVSWSDGSTANPRTDTNVQADKTVTAGFALSTYTLTYSAGANGSITGTSSQTVDYGSSGTTVTAVPNTGYHFVAWSDGSTANPRIDTNVTASKSLSATFAINTYSLKYSAGANGTISGTTSQTVAYGSSGTAVTAVPNTGYHFVNWSDGSTANPRTDTNVQADKNVTANFALNGAYTLSYIAGTNGTISGNATQSVLAGSSGTTVTAVPNTGYHFVNWSDGSTANPRRDTNIQADKTVTANFAINTYTLTYSAGANGSITGTTTQVVSHGGSGTPVTAVGNTGYAFLSWSDGSTANPRTDTNVTANKTLTATFALNSPASSDTTSIALSEYAWVDAPSGSSGGWGRFSIYANGTLIGTKEANATSTWDCPQTTVPSGARIDIVVDAGFTDASYYYDYNVPVTYSIQLPAGVTRLDAATWTGFPNFEVVDSEWYDYGGAYTYVGVPTSVIGNIKYSKPALGTVTLTYSAGAHGTISGTTPQTVVTGESGTAVTAVPDTGYRFVNWSDGSTANPRTDTNVLVNKSVTANFAVQTFTLSYGAGTGGTISGSSAQTVDYGASGTAVTALANPGYVFDKWSDGLTTATRTDSSVHADVDVLATFVALTNSKTFSATGANDTFTVPSGVTAIAVDAYGAEGVGWGNTSGGLGGYLHASVPVTPGQVLTIRVGTSSTGWPNGGAGSSYGGGGGGSSSVLLGTSVLVEAGGGGGSQGYDPGGDGGAGTATDPGGNGQGGNAGTYGAGGGGGWNGGGVAGDDTSGEGGTSRIAVGTGTMTAGVRGGDGAVTISW